jgi:glucose dehydrogenase
MLGDTVYLSTPLHNAVALDANTGRPLWRFNPDATEWGASERRGVGYVHQGVAVWSGIGAEPRRSFSTPGGTSSRSMPEPETIPASV